LNVCCLIGADFVYLTRNQRESGHGDDVEVNTLHNKAYGGDRAAEEELFQRLSDRFRRLAEWKIGDKPDAEEVAQEALVVVTRKYKRIDPASNFVAWAHKVLENEILRFYKRRGTRERKHEELSARAGTEPSWERAAELKRKLLECLGKIGRANIMYARILNFQHQGFAIDEMCHRLAVRKSYSYVLLSRARAMLKACLNGGAVQ
jgi:RNA polymerase sigma factor (sigma-70 family)